MGGNGFSMGGKKFFGNSFSKSIGGKSFFGNCFSMYSYTCFNKGGNCFSKTMGGNNFFGNSFSMGVDSGIHEPRQGYAQH